MPLLAGRGRMRYESGVSSNFPLSYKASWLPRLLAPSLGGNTGGFAPPLGGIQPSPGQSTRLVFLGDISAVAGSIAPRMDEDLRDTIASAALVIANCESPVVARPLRQPGTFLGARHAMTRQFLADTLAAAGISPEKLVLSLANNHALDQGPEGLDETLRVLAGLGIGTVGLASDGPVSTLAVGAMTIGFAAFTEWRNAGAAEFAGRVTMSDDFERAGWTALRQAKADLLCALPHWDREFRHFPEPATRQMAQRLAASGVGLVVGGHAHVIQPAERIGDTLVAYGLGDFLGTAWSRSRWPLRLGTMLIVDVVVAGDPAADGRRGRIASYEFRPFVRVKDGEREHLKSIAAVGGSLGKAIEARWRAVFYHN